MHLISLHPARWIFHVILAVFLPLLVGCGGRNGTFVSAPPPAGVNLTDLTNATQLQVDQLFAKINGDGKKWITVMDTDSLNLKLDGHVDDAIIGAILRQLPPVLDAGSDTVTNQFSRFGTISSPLDRHGDVAARRVVWGHQTSTLPDHDITYDISSLWNCVACDGAFDTRSGQAIGALHLASDNYHSSLDLAGDGLSQSASMLLDGQINFQTLGDMQLIFDGVEQQLDLQFVTGTLFVADTIEAGLVIGLETRQGALFSIMALGQIPN
jgi:hypothetical protein